MKDHRKREKNDVCCREHLMCTLSELALRDRSEETRNRETGDQRGRHADMVEVCER